MAKDYPSNNSTLQHSCLFTCFFFTFLTRTNLQGFARILGKKWLLCTSSLGKIHFRTTIEKILKIKITRCWPTSHSSITSWQHDWKFAVSDVAWAGPQTERSHENCPHKNKTLARHHPFVLHSAEIANTWENFCTLIRNEQVVLDKIIIIGWAADFFLENPNERHLYVRNFGIKLQNCT